MIESERPLKNLNLVNLFLSIISTAALLFLTSCQSSTSTTTSENTAKTTSSLDGSNCTGSIADTCMLVGTTQEACDGIAEIDCQWINDSCIPETNCASLGQIACQTAATISACTWNSICTGDISEGCRVFGISEVACNGLTSLDCQWVDGTCIAETNCNALEETACTYATTTIIPACIWGNACSGNLLSACAARSTSEYDCTNSDIGCGWTNETCVPTINCASWDEENCIRIALTTAPIVSCTWGGAISTVESGTCSGNPNAVGESQCQSNTNQNSCEQFGMRNISDPLFPRSLCSWDGSCHVKTTICAEQINEWLCFSASPPSYNLGNCVWTPN